MDTTPLGLYVTQVMEQVGADFDDDAVFRNIMIVLDVDTQDETVTVVSCDDDRPWVQLAFIEEAQATIEAGNVAFHPDDDS
jgi:hypothetical protein